MVKEQPMKAKRLAQMKHLQSQLPPIYDALQALADACKPRKLLIQREVYDWLRKAADHVRFAYNLIDISTDEKDRERRKE